MTNEQELQLRLDTFLLVTSTMGATKQLNDGKVGATEYAKFMMTAGLEYTMGDSDDFKTTCEAFIDKMHAQENKNNA